MAALVASLTWPAMALVVSPCGSAFAAQKSATLTRRGPGRVARSMSEMPTFSICLGLRASVANQVSQLYGTAAIEATY